MKNEMNALLECFEFLCILGIPVNEISKDMYMLLIDMGYLPSNLREEHEIADMFLIDFKYEFMSEDMLEFLVFCIQLKAKADIISEE